MVFRGYRGGGGGELPGHDAPVVAAVVALEHGPTVFVELQGEAQPRRPDVPREQLVDSLHDLARGAPLGVEHRPIGQAGRAVVVAHAQVQGETAAHAIGVVEEGADGLHLAVLLEGTLGVAVGGHAPRGVDVVVVPLGVVAAALRVLHAELEVVASPQEVVGEVRHLRVEASAVALPVVLVVLGAAVVRLPEVVAVEAGVARLDVGLVREHGRVGHVGRGVVAIVQEHRRGGGVRVALARQVVVVVVVREHQLVVLGDLPVELAEDAVLLPVRREIRGDPGRGELILLELV